VVLIGGATTLVWLHAAAARAPKKASPSARISLDRGYVSVGTIRVSPRKKISVTGASAFRVTAYANQPGEQVEVLYGRVQANKAYPSEHRDPEIVSGGEFSMINEVIDLMEKEQLDPVELRRWSEDMASADGRR
jgi:hypothetical protein